MIKPFAPEATITLQERDHEAIKQVRVALQAEPSLHLTAADGTVIELPEAARQALLSAIEHLAQGESIVVMPLGEELTTQEAADILNVSRPYLIKLLENGGLPFTLVGTHRRLRLRDVLDYQREMHARMRQGIRAIARLSQEAGAYD